jgi:c-di-GMP-binding flagellar brake protein YcgR
MTTADRKKRYNVTFEIVFDDGEGFMSGPVIDISETGCFIETVMPLEAGKLVRLTPLLPGETGLFEIEGEVVRKHEYDLDNHFDRTPGMGIRFVELSPGHREQLKLLLENLEKAS